MTSTSFDCRKICIAFPDSQRKISNYIAKIVKEKFQIECNIIIYELDKATTIQMAEIAKILGEECIFIIGYERKLSWENGYKLGLAHAYNVQVILIDLTLLSNQDMNFNCVFPKYLRYHYLIVPDPERLEDFILIIQNILSIILSGNLIDLLYQKAIDICVTIENKTGRLIPRVNQYLFQSNLDNILEKRDLLYDLYMTNDDYLYDVLTEAISENRAVILEILCNYQQISQQPNDSFQPPNTIIIHQYGKNDNVAGDRIDGNKYVGEDK